MPRWLTHAAEMFAMAILRAVGRGPARLGLVRVVTSDGRHRAVHIHQNAGVPRFELVPGGGSVLLVPDGWGGISGAYRSDQVVAVGRVERGPDADPLELTIGEVTA